MTKTVTDKKPEIEKPDFNPKEDQRTLSGTIAPGWTLKQNLPVTVELDDDGTVIVSDDIFLRYGAGERFEEALQDYIEDLTSYYEVVEEYATDDRPQNKALLELFREYLSHTG